MTALSPERSQNTYARFAGLMYFFTVFDVAGVFAGMVVLTAFVIAIDWLVTRAERRLLVWRPVVAETRT